MVIEGKLYRNTETFGQMDPFILIKHNGAKYRTPVLDDAGKNPVWNHLLIIPVNCAEDQLNKESLDIVCYDEDLMMDDCVGQDTFKVSQMVGHKQWYPLKYKGKMSAEILLDTHYMREEDEAEMVNLDTFEEMMKLGGTHGKLGDGSHTPYLGGATPGSLQTMESNGNVTTQKSINFSTMQRAIQSSIMKRVINKKVNNQLNTPQPAEEQPLVARQTSQGMKNNLQFGQTGSPSMQAKVSLQSQSTQQQLLQQVAAKRQHQSTVLLDPLSFKNDFNSVGQPKPAFGGSQNRKSSGESSTLQIKIVEAILSRDTEVIGKMDPFILVECEGKDYRTKVMEEGGKNPKWNEMVTVSLQNPQGNIRFVCYDEDIAINDLVGEAIIKISTISQGSVKRHSFPLLFKGKQSGELFIETKYIPAIIVEAQSDELEQSLSLGNKLPRISRNDNPMFASADYQNYMTGQSVQSAMTPMARAGLSTFGLSIQQQILQQAVRGGGGGNNQGGARSALGNAQSSPNQQNQQYGGLNYNAGNGQGSPGNYVSQLQRGSFIMPGGNFMMQNQPSMNAQAFSQYMHMGSNQFPPIGNVALSQQLQNGYSASVFNYGQSPTAMARSPKNLVIIKSSDKNKDLWKKVPDRY